MIHGSAISREHMADLPIRRYEAFWQQYWQPAFPRIAGTTWPEEAPYFALSSGTSTGTTKYIPVSREMVLNFVAQTSLGLPRSY